MEQRGSTAWDEKRREEMRREIMGIQDRRKRHEAIARNLNLFMGKEREVKGL